MQSISLLGGLGFDPRAFNIDRTKVFTETVPVTGEMPNRTCSRQADGSLFVWIATTATTPGHWERLRVGQTPEQVCTGYSDGGPVVRDHRDGGVPQGGTIVTNPSGEIVDSKIDIPPVIDLGSAITRDGRGPMIEVGPFRFPADVEKSSFWWNAAMMGPLPPEYQAAIGHAWKYGEDPVLFKMTPALSMLFDKAPDMYNGRFIGTATSRAKLLDSQPWYPILRSKHPKTGKDYGVFVGMIPRYRDKPMNDPENPIALYFVWAPIQKSWYERLWDWIVEVVGKIVDFVCDKLTDPATAAAVTAGAAAVGGPVTVGVVGGATLLCQSIADRPPDAPPVLDQPAIEPKPVWPYYLAGGVALFGVIAFLLASPKKKPALKPA